MTTVMSKAVTMDENGDARKEEELYQRLITENKVSTKHNNMQFFFTGTVGKSETIEKLSCVPLGLFMEIIWYSFIFGQIILRKFHVPVYRLVYQC